MEKIILQKDENYNKTKRKKKSILTFLCSRLFIIIILVIVQIAILFYFSEYLTKAWVFMPILDVIFTLIIINDKKIKESYKITWLVFISFLPIFGALFYIVLNIVNSSSKLNKKLRDNILQSKKYYVNSEKDTVVEDSKKFIEEYSSKLPIEIAEHLSEEKTLFNYFLNGPELPPYTNTALHYFDNGKEAFEDIFEKMQGAKKFIFIEIFILSDGIIWQNMLNILKEKAKEGVEVRLMFDGLNALSSFKKSYCDELAKYGIEAKMYKPLIPILTSSQNRRDHRKIFVIDNEIAYTGGINIADEYANLYERFGVWKDVGIRVNGNAVESFTIMFLHLWNIYNESNIIEYEKYLPVFNQKVGDEVTNGIVVPYTDYPSCGEDVSVEIIKFMLSNANETMSIMTPYLVIDESMLASLESAAKRGVDVKLIVPHIPDKKYVFILNRSYYKSLTNAGVKVYEYIPGFIHAKVFMQDGIRAIVGTCNLDFRSLYLHSENGVYLTGNEEALDAIKKDFENTLKECRLMDHVEISKFGWMTKIIGAVLKIFAPLF